MAKFNVGDIVVHTLEGRLKRRIEGMCPSGTKYISSLYSVKKGDFTDPLPIGFNWVDAVYTLHIPVVVENE